MPIPQGIIRQTVYLFYFNIKLCLNKEEGVGGRAHFLLSVPGLEYPGRDSFLLIHGITYDFFDWISSNYFMDFSVNDVDWFAWMDLCLNSKNNSYVEYCSVLINGLSGEEGGGRIDGCLRVWSLVMDVINIVLFYFTINVVFLGFLFVKCLSCPTIWLS